MQKSKLFKLASTNWIHVLARYRLSLPSFTFHVPGSSSKDAPFVGRRVIYQADEQLYISIGN